MHEHLWISDVDGHLYDIRDSYRPLRWEYLGFHQSITTIAHLKASLRDERQYRIGVYYVSTAGLIISPEAVWDNIRDVFTAIKHNDDGSGWRVCWCKINWHDTELYCHVTDKRIFAVEE